PDIAPPPDLMVNTMFSRTVLPVSDNPQLLYIMLDMMAMPDKSEKLKEKRPMVNICLVLDTSTSMAGERLDRVKAAAIEIMRQLRTEDILSVVTFNDRAEVIMPATRGLNYNTLESRISMLKTGGGTEIYQGLKAGFDEVTNFLDPAFINHIILITDGRTYGDEQECLDLAKKAAAKGITISGMGIGNEWNDHFIDKIVKSTGGNSIYAAKSDDITRYLTKKFSRLSMSYANHVSLAFSSMADVELRYAFRLSPEPGPIDTESPLQIGAVPLEPSLSVILEFLIPPLKKEMETITIAEGKLKLEIPTNAIPTTTSNFSFCLPVRTNPEITPPPQALVKAMSRLSLYRLQEQARTELAEGDIEKGSVRLQNLATQLLISGQAGLAHTVMLELKAIEGGNSLSGEGEKQIKYGTRALFLPASTEDDPL
ncbi:MAG: VWA domain-containing protein, partial [Anaerolineae bacterium]|nr:VWA domain-containing protein [Anaerolineae bacterium]